MDHFKFKKDYMKILDELTDKQAGELIKGVAAYAFDNKPFATKDAYLKGLFHSAKREIDVSRQNSTNGKKGAEKLAANKARIAAAELGGLVSVMIAKELTSNKEVNDGE